MNFLFLLWHNREKADWIGRP